MARRTTRVPNAALPGRGLVAARNSVMSAIIPPLRFTVVVSSPALPAFVLVRICEDGTAQQKERKHCSKERSHVGPPCA